MPNWCFTEYRAVGNPHEIHQLYNLMEKLDKMSKSLVKNDFGTTWFGNLVTALGENWTTIKCRGSWSNLTMVNEDEIYFMAESAWVELSEVRHLIERKFPSVHLYYISEEPGCGIYQTNDNEGRYFVVTYCVDTEEDGVQEFTAKSDAIERVEEIVGRKLEENEDPAEAMWKWGEANGTTATYYEYKIVDD